MLGNVFQVNVYRWLMLTFGEEVANDPVERSFRFLEEALELVQANKLTREQAHELVDYVFSRPVGDISQEVGGVAITLAALCSPLRIDIGEVAELELERIWLSITRIRAKQATKPHAIRGATSEQHDGV